MLIGQQDGEATYERLRRQIESGDTLAAEERLDLIFLPLMRHHRSRQEVITQALLLARRLPGDEQRQALAALLGLGNRFLTETELDTLLEGLMSTNLGERLIERGYERGIQRGREEGIQTARHAVLRVLAKQIGAVPPETSDRVERVTDLAELERLLNAALAARSIDEFTQSLS